MVESAGDNDESEGVDSIAIVVEENNTRKRSAKKKRRALPMS